MTDERLVECERCGEARTFDELVEVIEVRSGHLFHLCRPVGRSWCFRDATQSVNVHAIREAARRRPAA